MDDTAGGTAVAVAGRAESGRSLGLAAGIAAYGSWGLVPLYFKLVGAARPLEVLSHRVVWSVVFLLALLARRRALGELGAALRPGRTLALLSGSAVLIAVNWLVYIWAVDEGRVLEGSLGYFITPLVNVVLGVLVLGERLALPVVLALGVAGGGVAYLTASLGHAPWTSLVLAVSFGSYGLLRKLAPVPATVGLTVETLVLGPLALAYLLWATASGHLAFRTGGPALAVLLVLAGPITAVPLIFFAAAARRLPLTTLGFLQYLSPTLQFLLAVLLFKEPLDRPRAVAFACIWAGLAIFTAYSLRRLRERPGFERT
jgi:chloramphenicol-sensitive protein RarD